MRFLSALFCPVAGLVALLALAACDDGDTSAASQPAHPRVPIQQFLPGYDKPQAAAPAAGTNGGQPGVTAAEGRQNDPSAAADTPLCGPAQREAVATDAAVVPDVTAAAGACAETACFDPLTDTFIGTDGARHVCQE